MPGLIPLLVDGGNTLDPDTLDNLVHERLRGGDIADPVGVETLNLWTGFSHQSASVSFNADFQWENIAGKKLDVVTLNGIKGVKGGTGTGLTNTKNISAVNRIQMMGSSYSGYDNNIGNKFSFAGLVKGESLNARFFNKYYTSQVALFFVGTDASGFLQIYVKDNSSNVITCVLNFKATNHTIIWATLENQTLNFYGSDGVNSDFQTATNLTYDDTWVGWGGNKYTTLMCGFIPFSFFGQMDGEMFEFWIFIDKLTEAQLNGIGKFFAQKYNIGFTPK